MKIVDLYRFLSIGALIWGGGLSPALYAGNVGDIYNNCDGWHTRPDMSVHPGAITIQDVGCRDVPTNTDQIKIGNASVVSTYNMAMTFHMFGSLGSNSAYQHYTHNHAFWYPAHVEFGERDLFPAMTPTVSASIGKSGSELDEVHKFFYTLGAFSDPVKTLLKQRGLLMPTIQMIFRRTRVSSDEDYFTTKAHPGVFGNYIDPVIENDPTLSNSEKRERNMLKQAELMQNMARSMQTNNVPPMVQLKVIDDNYKGVNGRDFYELEGPAAKEFNYDMPVSISRFFKGREYTKFLIVSAEDSYDINNRPLTYHWKIIRGDPERVRITKLNASGSRVRIEIDYHTTSSIHNEGADRSTNLVAVAAFVNNGTYYSAPAFVTSYSMGRDLRTYDPQTKRLLEMRRGPTPVIAYLYTVKNWEREVYHYDNDGNFKGFTRHYYRNSDRTYPPSDDFTPEGFLVKTKNPNGTPLTVQKVEYVKSGSVLIARPIGNPFPYAGDIIPPGILPLEITRPREGATLRGNVSLTATLDPSFTRRSVSYLADGIFIAFGSNNNFAATWDTTKVPDGQYRLMARTGSMITDLSHSILVTVANSSPGNPSEDNTPPSVQITNPSHQTIVQGTVHVTATASDNVGVRNVQFYVDGALSTTDTTSPYSFSWNTTQTTNGSHTILVRASDAAGNIREQNVTVTVSNTVSDTTLPQVQISAPANQTTVQGNVTIAATASDNVGVSNVQFFIDGALKATDSSSPYSFTWNSLELSNGSHSIRARASDAAGNIREQTITITVANPDITEPTVQITAPINSSTVQGQVTLSASASDNVGVTNVQFFMDGTLLVTDFTAPYSHSWDSTQVSNGSHIVKARATDAAGNIREQTVTITVSNPDITLPNVQITAPLNLATVQGSITISATASDNRGVSNVQFFVDGTSVGTDTSSPYSISWDSTQMTNGTRIIKARASDAAGNSREHTVIVTISNPDITLPTIQITAPQNQATVQGQVALSATATDNIGILNVQFFVDGTLVRTDTTSPYSFTWNSTLVANGPHSVKARASDAAGNIREQTVAITVANPDITSPTIQITAPANQATVQGQITISATASDNIGVTNVQFFADEVLIGSDNSAPYSLSWNSSQLSNGTHELVARASDAAGNIEEDSIAISINTVIIDTTRPNVQITTPLNQASLQGQVSISATATDNAAVSNVQFFINGVLLRTDTTSPYQATWNAGAVSNGAHTVLARARDTSGNTRDHSISVVVANPDVTDPAIQITQPVNLATVRGQITLAATAIDNVAVTQVQFKMDGIVLGADTSAPYQLTWDTLSTSNGLHTLTVEARDAAGNIDEDSISVTVSNQDLTPPTVQITHPVHQDTIQQNVTISVTATDNIVVSQVQFFLDGNLIGTDQSAPYTLLWDTIESSNGTHELKVKAFDNSGNTREQQISVTVDNSDPLFLTVQITTPFEDENIEGTVPFIAEAFPIESIRAVEFFVDGESIGSDTSAPYQVFWDSTRVFNGVHELSVRVTDLSGALQGDIIFVNVLNLDTPVVRQPTPVSNDVNVIGTRPGQVAEFTFTLQSAEHVSIRVYDRTYREVATVLDQGKEAGEHKATWDGTNSDGTPVSSGAYFVRMQLGNILVKRKVAVIR